MVKSSASIPSCMSGQWEEYVRTHFLTVILLVSPPLSSPLFSCPPRSSSLLISAQIVARFRNRSNSNTTEGEPRKKYRIVGSQVGSHYTITN